MLGLWPWNMLSIATDKRTARKNSATKPEMLPIEHGGRHAAPRLDGLVGIAERHCGVLSVCVTLRNVAQSPTLAVVCAKTASVLASYSRRQASTHPAS